MNPEANARRICEFLGLKYSGEMTETQNFLDGFGQPWRQNTSYGNGTQSFDVDAIDRWRRYLSVDEIAFIETICTVEMGLHGYGLDQQRSSVVAQHMFSPPEPPYEELAGWIQDVWDGSSLNIAIEMAKENMRFELLKASEEHISEIDSTVIDACFLFQDLFQQGRHGASVLDLQSSGGLDG